jgi:predicted ATPase
MNGAGHADYCNIRISREGLSRAELEKVHRNVVYFARQYVCDYRTGAVSAAYLKIGQSTLFNSLQRGRNQAGGDFRILAELCFKSSDDAKLAEKNAQHLFQNQQVKGTQNQKELFLIHDEEVESFVRALIAYCTTDNDHPLPFVEALLFTGGQETVDII